MPLISAAKTEVLKHLANVDDGTNSPELLAQIGAALGTVQRNLCLEHAELLARLSSAVALSAGRQWYPLPTTIEGILEVRVAIGQRKIALDYGLTLDDVLETTAGIPTTWGLRRTTGVVSVTASGGSGYTNGAPVTFTAPGGSGSTATGYLTAAAGVLTGVVVTDPGAEYAVPPTLTLPGGTGGTATAVLGSIDEAFVSPPPADSGTLAFAYRNMPSSVVADGDQTAFDFNVLVAATAAHVAAASKMPAAEALAGLARKSLSLIEQRGPMRPAGAGGGFSLGGRRI